MTFEEALKIVDAGGFVARESDWGPRAAGFSWGVWIRRTRKWTDADLEKAGEGLLNIAPTGPYIRTFHTLCETAALGADVDNEWSRATDWLDVTDRFENGLPKGYVEYMHGLGSS